MSNKKPMFTTNAPATFDNVALVSAGLGVVIGLGTFLSFNNFPLGFYMISMATFHLLEFWVTAKYNKSNLGMNSFLLTNGIAYIVAQAIGAIEIVFRFQNTPPKLAVLLGLLFILVGQYVRTKAMIQAAESFNHYVQVEKRPEHKLVRSGMYSIVRHPSYFGYYFWAVGTQLLVGNWVTFVFFGVSLNMYFRQRLRTEEQALIKFFGQEYVNYQKEVWSGIFLH